jgi:hypothetical protein
MPCAGQPNAPFASLLLWRKIFFAKVVNVLGVMRVDLQVLILED